MEDKEDEGSRCAVKAQDAGTWMGLADLLEDHPHNPALLTARLPPRELLSLAERALSTLHRTDEPLAPSGMLPDRFSPRMGLEVTHLPLTSVHPRLAHLEEHAVDRKL